MGYLAFGRSQRLLAGGGAIKSADSRILSAQVGFAAAELRKELAAEAQSPLSAPEKKLLPTPLGPALKNLS